MKYILARDNLNYRYFCDKNNLDMNEYKYANHPRDFFGAKIQLILLTGYEDNPLYDQIYEAIKFFHDCEYVNSEEDYPKRLEEIIYA